MITYKLSDLKGATTETADGMTYVYYQGHRMGTLEGDTVTIPKYMINRNVLAFLEGVPYKIARLVFIIQEIDELLGVIPVKYFTASGDIQKAIEKAFEPYCGEVTIEDHWLLGIKSPEWDYYLDYEVLDEL